MKITSTIIASGSGSLGGLTASRNKGGLYLRARAIPTNPNTTQQQNVRQAMATLADAWTNLLTQVQRDGWDVYAANTPVIDTLGASMLLTGQQMYLRSNIPRIQSGYARVDASPTIFDFGSFSTPGMAGPTASNDSFDLSFTNTDLWANETGSYMTVFVGRPTNPSVRYFKGPYRLAAGIIGDDTTAPTSPSTIVSPFTLTAGQRLNIKVNVTRVDGRYSGAFRTNKIVV